MKKLFLTAAIFLLALLCSCAKSESITDTTNGTDSTEESSALSDTESTMIESSSETEMGETTEETGTWANLQYSEDMDWLEFVVCNAFQKYPEELEPEDFQRIKRVSITLYNDISNEYYSEINSIRIYI